MALFGKLFGKNKETAKKKDVEKEISCMIVIPKNEVEADNYALLEERLKASELIALKDSAIDNEWRLKIASSEMEYDVNISTTEVEIPEMFRIQHFFRDIDIEAIQRQKKGLVVEMFFNDSICGFHDGNKTQY